MINSDTYGDICISHILRCPEDHTISLGDYLTLSRMNPDTDKIKKVPLFGKVMVPKLKRSAPPLAKGVYPVKANLQKYWFGKSFFTRGESLYLELESLSGIVLSDSELSGLSDSQILRFEKENRTRINHVFRKPLRTSAYADRFSKDKLKEYYSNLLDTIGEEIVIGAERATGFDSVSWASKPGQSHKYRL